MNSSASSTPSSSSLFHRIRTSTLSACAAVAVYLAYLGLSGTSSGVLLWPAVVLHLVLTVLLARDAIAGKSQEP